ncbi:hypothetical protein DEU56DRAFT_826623 [Suillus clintonianus]|uniref:uncharacterized protein n=1 Tax=Suillus clintonianus TaxID=1904413 RepID=UPI001B85D853|nr:uncharacterized protein DEU56DRAFT_826623 [Suillus clintonianus]KAG2124809.1 hypothetical protein DEU56DRAFT_826623 [Suillus clintonianus]
MLRRCSSVLELFTRWCDRLATSLLLPPVMGVHNTATAHYPLPAGGRTDNIPAEDFLGKRLSVRTGEGVAAGEGRKASTHCKQQK